MFGNLCPVPPEEREARPGKSEQDRYGQQRAGARQAWHIRSETRQRLIGKRKAAKDTVREGATGVGQDASQSESRDKD